MTSRPLLPARAWRALTKMRTAIILLFLLAAGAAIGSLFPQRSIDPRAVDRWISENPGWERFARSIDLFDVFGSWWFASIALLLVTSLVGCLTRRYRQQLRLVRATPRAPRDLPERQRYLHARSDASPDEVRAAASRLLRRRRFRVALHGDTVAAERGHIRESGSLVFHTAILLLLAGVAIGRLFGATGQTLLVEGETFTDTRVEYDSFSPGRAFRAHTGFQLTLDEFDVSWHPSGVPRAFTSQVSVDRPGSLLADPSTIAVNHPLTVLGRRVYQIAWGWAPVLRVEQDGRVLYDGPTVFLPDAGGWTGVAKIPQTHPQQTGLAMQLFVDPFEDADGTLRDRNREPRDPIIVAQVLAGDLGLEAPQSVYRLDPEGLSRLGQEIVAIGRTADLPNDVTLSFTDLVQYSVFQVGYNPGARILFAAAILLLVGLGPGLYGFRRRIWVRATDDRDGTILEVAGHAFQRQQQAAEELDRFVADLDRELAAQYPRPAPSTIEA